MHLNLKLHFTKQLINLAVRVLSKFMKQQKTTYPQTQLLQKIGAQAIRAYKLEVAYGVFKEKHSVSDGNFERLITLGLNMLTYIAENDRYYRAWLGYIILLSSRTLTATDYTPKLLKKELKRQWSYDLDFMKDKQVEGFKQDFVDSMLCNHLANYAVEK